MSSLSSIFSIIDKAPHDTAVVARRQGGIGATIGGPQVGTRTGAKRMLAGTITADSTISAANTNGAKIAGTVGCGAAVMRRCRNNDWRCFICLWRWRPPVSVPIISALPAPHHEEHDQGAPETGRD